MDTKARARPRGRPRKAERAEDESRRELLDAALVVFGARGYQGATVDEVVTQANLSKGTFYWTFDSKESLFLSLVDERLDQPIREVMAVTERAPADEPTSADVSAALAHIFVEQRDLLLLLFDYWAAATRDPDVASRYRERHDALRATLARALTARHARTGVKMTLPADDLAEAFIALGHGLALHALVDRQDITASLFGQIASLVYDGMVLRGQGQDERSPG